MSPTARTLNRLRRQGFLAEAVEKWLPRVICRRDPFRVGDVLGVHPVERVTLLVQVTSHGNVSSRVKKCQGRPETAQLLRAGWRVQVWGWRGNKLRRVNLTLADLGEVTIVALPRKRPRKGERQGELFG
jgi:hypothetical protein